MEIHLYIFDRFRTKKEKMKSLINDGCNQFVREIGTHPDTVITNSNIKIILVVGDKEESIIGFSPDKIEVLGVNFPDEVHRRIKMMKMFIRGEDET